MILIVIFLFLKLNNLISISYFSTFKLNSTVSILKSEYDCSFIVLECSIIIAHTPYICYSYPPSRQTCPKLIFNSTTPIVVKRDLLRHPSKCPSTWSLKLCASTITMGVSLWSILHSIIEKPLSARSYKPTVYKKMAVKFLR